MPNYNQELRNKLKIYKNFSCKIKKASYELFFDLLPICYLEGYKEIISTSSKMGWPKNPMFVYTANSYDTDEVFKVWTAGKIENGTKYFIGQHGSGFGIVNNHQDTDYCSKVADKFFTWGVFDHTEWKKRYKDYSKKFKLLGSPRIDLWKDKIIKSIYKNELVQIQNKFKDNYILIVSSFITSKKELSY